MQCTINDKIATGMGPNKKTAKKNAAENMLRTMGHAPSVSQFNRKLKSRFRMFWTIKYFRLSNLTMKINQLIRNKNLNLSNQRFHQSHHRSLPPLLVRNITLITLLLRNFYFRGKCGQWRRCSSPTLLGTSGRISAPIFGIITRIQSHLFRLS